MNYCKKLCFSSGLNFQLCIPIVVTVQKLWSLLCQQIHLRRSHLNWRQAYSHISLPGRGGRFISPVLMIFALFVVHFGCCRRKFNFKFETKKVRKKKENGIFSWLSFDMSDSSQICAIRSQMLTFFSQKIIILRGLSFMQLPFSWGNPLFHTSLLLNQMGLPSIFQRYLNNWGLTNII